MSIEDAQQILLVDIRRGQGYGLDDERTVTLARSY